MNTRTSVTIATVLLLLLAAAAGLYWTLWPGASGESGLRAQTSTACSPTMEHYDVEVRSVNTTVEPHHVEIWHYEYVGTDYYGYTGEGDQKVEHLKRGDRLHTRVGGGEWNVRPALDRDYVGFCEPLPNGLTESGGSGGSDDSPQRDSDSQDGVTELDVTYARGNIEYRLVETEEKDGKQVKRYSTARPSAGTTDGDQRRDPGTTPADEPEVDESDYLQQELWVDDDGYIVVWARAHNIPVGDVLMEGYVVAEQSGFNETNVLPEAPPFGNPAVESATPNSVRVSWDRLRYVGDRYIGDIRVRYRHTLADPWAFGGYVDIATWSNRRPEANVTGLPCGTGHQFRVEYTLSGSNRWHSYGVTSGFTSACPEGSS